MNKIIILTTAIFFTASTFAQQVELNASGILLEIEKMNNTASVLYIAAHPDDENTRLIAYLANELKVRTGYLSLTRGDGGQNLIGDEQGAYLGVIRTQELLAARKTDGAEQFFTRAVDFGYSKNANETFTKWPHDSLLSDVVWVIRNFRPDVIIMRFPPDERAGHGQHTVSAIIAEEAFDAAADPSQFPEQLKYVQPWKTKRLFLNNSNWWDKDLMNKIANADSNLISFDDGGYNPLLGKSYGEIASVSRTNHKSQGFGTAAVRGVQMEYLELVKGTFASDHSLLDDAETSWEKYPGGETISKSLTEIQNNFNFLHPEYSVDKLLLLYDQLNNLHSDAFIEYKKKKLQDIIVACLGLWLEPVALKQEVLAGEKVVVVSTSLKRAAYAVSLDSINFNSQLFKVGEILIPAINQTDSIQIAIPDCNCSPYWLENNYNNLFDIPDQMQRGKAENDPCLVLTYHVKIGNRSFAIQRAVVYKETDAVRGEIYKPVLIVPPATFRFENKIIAYSGDKPVKIIVDAKINAPDFNSRVYLNADGFQITPEYYQVTESGRLEFNAIPVGDHDTEIGVVVAHYHDQILTDAEYTIEYEHIPEQVIFEDAVVKLVRVNTEIPKMKIGYVEGAGDLVDESLRQMGLDITTIKPEEINANELKKYNVIIVGVRAYNVSKKLADANNILMDFVKNGGLVIAQYSTNWDSYLDQQGPYAFKISRDRVTDENSPVDFLLPDHPVLNYPNKIAKSDFDGWVQERGIYFASDVAPEYSAPLSFTDPGEQPKSGSLIIADYGKGAFMYTGITFFRELPAGVPGAYRLFINMIEYKNGNK